MFKFIQTIKLIRQNITQNKNLKKWLESCDNQDKLKVIIKIAL